APCRIAPAGCTGRQGASYDGRDSASPAHGCRHPDRHRARSEAILALPRGVDSALVQRANRDARLHRAQPRVLCAAGGQVVGFDALSGTGSTRELEHMWVAPEHPGVGIGAALFERAVETARAEGAPELRIASDPNAR